MLGGYAAHDHRANGDQAKKACIRIPARAVRDSICRFDEQSIRYPKAVRYRGKNELPSLLF